MGNYDYKCDKCKRKIRGFSFRCKYCGNSYCEKHRLPEDHNCLGLEKIRDNSIKRWRDTFQDFAHDNNKENYTNEDNSKEHNKYQRIKEEQVGITKTEKSSFSKKIKYTLSYNLEELRDWLMRRNHSKYNFYSRKKYIFKIVLIFLISILGIFFFYSRADQFNQVSMWIFNLGGILIVVSIFFAIIYGWLFLKELNNLIKRQRKWVKIVLFILLIIVLWLIFSNGTVILEKTKSAYSKTEFSLFAPFSLSKSPAYSGQEISLPSFFKDNNCTKIEEHAVDQYINSGKYKRNFCSAVCSDKNLEYQRYTCDKQDKFHCYCKIIKNG